MTPPPETPPEGLIGASPRRKEDRRLLTGAGRYVDDLRRPGLLHMAVVRSRHAHARIIKIGVEAARALPGVAAVWTVRDLPEIKPAVFGVSGKLRQARIYYSLPHAPFSHAPLRVADLEEGQRELGLT